jgi:AraC-like DNA-binding protein
MNAPSVERTIAFARFPSLIRDAARSLQQLTGLTAVTTFGSASPDMRTRGLPSPPVHPLCAKLLREASPKSPCDAEWQKHLELAVRMRACRMHICPLGLRCASVPILLGDDLLGLAKLVSPPEVPKKRFRSFVDLLEVLIARPCQELYVGVLREEVHNLRVSVERLQQVTRMNCPALYESDAPVAKDQINGHSPQAQTLISQILDYLNEHYADSELTLVQIATALGKNEKYVTHLFAQQVGERMRTYITTRRVRRACELLLQTDRTIYQIACDSGFAHASHFRQSFRRTIGVTASEYRQIFTA